MSLSLDWKTSGVLLCSWILHQLEQQVTYRDDKLGQFLILQFGVIEQLLRESVHERE
jgi:hypothetical protein